MPAYTASHSRIYGVFAIYFTLANMPDTSWVCPSCGEKNPPYTEACRNCYFLSTVPEGQSASIPTTVAAPGHAASVPLTANVDYPRLFLTPKTTERLYWFAAAYTLLMLIARENGVLLIEVLGFGLPVLLFLCIEWVVPVLIAALAGFQSKWSFKAAFRAFPLVAVFACISPFVAGKNIVLPAHLPWMAAAPASIGQAIEAVGARAPFWGLIYVLAFALGHAMRSPSASGEHLG